VSSAGAPRALSTCQVRSRGDREGVCQPSASAVGRGPPRLIAGCGPGRAGRIALSRARDPSASTAPTIRSGGLAGRGHQAFPTPLPALPSVVQQARANSPRWTGDTVGPPGPASPPVAHIAASTLRRAPRRGSVVGPCAQPTSSLSAATVLTSRGSRETSPQARSAARYRAGSAAGATRGGRSKTNRQCRGRVAFWVRSARGRSAPSSEATPGGPGHPAVVDGESAATTRRAKQQRRGTTSARKPEKKHGKAFLSDGRGRNRTTAAGLPGWKWNRHHGCPVLTRGTPTAIVRVSQLTRTVMRTSSTAWTVGRRPDRHALAPRGGPLADSSGTSRSVAASATTAAFTGPEAPHRSLVTALGFGGSPTTAS